MTGFEKWYTKNWHLDPLNPISKTLMRQAYEAGAASQSGTLRDKFAGQAMAGLYSDPELEMSDDEIAAYSYRMADAMLEARKVTK
jgi:hypothetical protein